MTEIRKVFVDEPQFPQLPPTLSPRKVIVDDATSPFVPQEGGGLIDLSPILEDYGGELSKQEILSDPNLWI